MHGLSFHGHIAGGASSTPTRPSTTTPLLQQAGSPASSPQPRTPGLSQRLGVRRPAGFGGQRGGILRALGVPASGCEEGRVTGCIQQSGLSALCFCFDDGGVGWLQGGRGRDPGQGEPQQRGEAPHCVQRWQHLLAHHAPRWPGLAKCAEAALRLRGEALNPNPKPKPPPNTLSSPIQC